MKNNRFSMYVSIIVTILFLTIGIRVFLHGSYLFAVIWILITASILYQNILMIRKNRQRDDSCFYEQNQQSSSSSIEKERLQKLEDLYRSGLISREEYDKKREDIINSI